MEYEIVNGIYAEITKLSVRNIFVVLYGGKQYHILNTGNYQIFYGKEKLFDTKEECLGFCKSIGVKVIKDFEIDPFARGVPRLTRLSDFENVIDILRAE